MDRGVLALVVLVGHVLAERYENGAAEGIAAVQALVAGVRPSAAPCQTAQMADVSAPCRQSKIDPTGTQMNDCEFCNGVYRESHDKGSGCPGKNSTAEQVEALYAVSSSLHLFRKVHPTLTPAPNVAVRGALQEAAVSLQGAEAVWPM